MIKGQNFRRYFRPYFFWIGGFAGVLLGVVLSCHPTVLSGFHLMQTDPGDTRFNNYILEHGYLWLLGHPQHASFWNAPFFFPSPNVLAYSDILLGAAPIYWLIRAVGFLPDTAYQLWTMALLALNFGVALGVFNKIGFSLFSSLVSAYLFAFANMRVGQIGHPQLLPQFYTLFAVLALYRVFERDHTQSRSRVNAWIAVLVSAVVAQLYAGFYLGWFVIFGGFMLAVIGFCKRSTRPTLISFTKRNYRALLIAGLLAVVALIPEGLHYWKASREVGMRSFGEVASMIPRIQSWLYMGDGNLLYGSLQKQFSAFRKLPVPDEQRAGLGWVTWLLVMAGFWSARKKVSVQLAALLWLGVGVSALYTGRRFFGIEPWDWVYAIFPGGKAIRAVGRISFLTLIPACIGLAHFFEGINKKKILSWGLFFWVILEQVNTTPSYDKMAIRTDVDAIAARVPRTCEVFFYSTSQSSDPDYKLHLDAMWAGLSLGIPTINGFSGNFPPGWFLESIGKEGQYEQLKTALGVWNKNSQIRGFQPQCWVSSFR